MSMRFTPIVIAALSLTGCATSFNTPNAKGHYSWSQQQCVPYARKASGIQLYGDAHTWWNQAEGKYMRGYYPVPGAVLVLARTKRMTHGHLAVVKDIVSQRQINVTQSNWGSGSISRRVIYEAQRAEDVSAANDWSMIRFWNKDEGAFGFPYAAMGFIYR